MLGEGFFQRRYLGVEVFEADKETSIAFIEQLPISVTVEKMGNAFGGQCQISIRGLTYDSMKSLTAINSENVFKNIPRRFVRVYAGDVDKVYDIIFEGDIIQAFSDFNTVPEPTMNIACVTCNAESLMVNLPFTLINNESSVYNILKFKAQECGSTIIIRDMTNGRLKLPKDSHFSAMSFLDFAKEACRRAGGKLVTDDNCLIISDNGGAITQDPPVEINVSNGMIGYPSIDAQGITVTSLFNPNLKFGGRFTVESSMPIPMANQEFQIVALTHNLTANDPRGGEWKTTVRGYWFGGIA